LYQSDNSHPSAAGSYLAACTFYASIFHTSPIGFTYSGGLNQSTATFLQTIASNTVLDSLDVWRNGTFLADASFTFQANTNTLQFAANDVHSNATHTWLLGDGNTANTAQLQHTYATGSYQVTHILTRFCSGDTSTQTITVGATTHIEKWSEATPNDPIISIHDVCGHEMNRSTHWQELPKGTYIVTFQGKNNWYRRKYLVL
jgi:hypothetical protein